MTLTHAEQHSYSLSNSASSESHNAFKRHQTRYGLPYGLYGFSTKVQVLMFINDMKACITQRGNPNLVFGGWTDTGFNGQVDTIVWTSRSSI